MTDIIHFLGELYLILLLLMGCGGLLFIMGYLSHLVYKMIRD